MSPAAMRQDDYSARFGPTTGDRVRLADTDLWMRVEGGHVGSGDEPVWGYARNIRSRMTQQDRATADSELDVLIAGVLVVDPLLGVIKTSIGVKEGRIVGIGRAGNPDVTSGVDLTIGPNTLPLMGYGLIATAGAGDDNDVAVALPTDGLNESCELEDTVAAIAGRAVHAYHVEGAGGGHIPDLISLVREPAIICSSTTPTIPYGTGTVAEHPEMILAVHGGSGADPADFELAAERVRPATLAAEGPLHELGAISIINSDSQGMGRIGETISRVWQLAVGMKSWRSRTDSAPGPIEPSGRP